jgi:predicted metalloprotease with PDZ domain
MVRDSTREARGLDDVMRALFARSITSAGRGYAPGEFEEVAESVCRCRLDTFFAREVRGAEPIDMRPLFGRLGLREIVDSVPAVDSVGNALPDLRVVIDFTLAGAPRLVIRDSATPWAKAGLRTGDRLLTIGGEPVRAFQDFRRAVSRVRVDNTELTSSIPVEIERQGQRMRVSVAVLGYRRARVRLVDAEVVTPTERARRDLWLRGGD